MFKILIAEDDRELRQLFQHVLTKHGYSVRGVSNGQEALDALEQDYCDLIISDIMMPVMDGYQLVQALRESGSQIPVLMITAKNAFDDMRQGFLSGTDDYMVKPVNINEMVLRVGALLRRAQMINDRRQIIGETVLECVRTGVSVADPLTEVVSAARFLWERTLDMDYGSVEIVKLEEAIPMMERVASRLRLV